MSALVVSSGRQDVSVPVVSSNRQDVSTPVVSSGRQDVSALVLLSGGQDSTTCLYWAMREYGKVWAIGFNYGQRHVAELEYARAICDDLDISFEIIPLPAVNALTENALTRKDIAVEAAPKTDKNENTISEQIAKNNPPPNTLVEGRNLLFLTYAAIYAKARDIRVLVTGVCESDFSGYPDCRDIFIKSAQVTLNLCMDYPFIIETPMMWRNKAQTWALAQELGALDIVREKTLTCYNGIAGDGCGGCPACVLRARGWEQYKKQTINADSEPNIV